MALDKCPETGADISEMTAEELQAHHDSLYPSVIPFPQQNKEAVKRSDLLKAEINRRRMVEARQPVRPETGKGGE